MTEFEYAPALESTSILNLQSDYNLFINGKYVPAKTGKRFPTINPATGEAIANVA